MKGTSFLKAGLHLKVILIRLARHSALQVPSAKSNVEFRQVLFPIDEKHPKLDNQKSVIFH